MHQIIIGNNKKNVEVIEKNRFLIDGKEHSLDIENIGENIFSVIKNNTTYRIEVLDHDLENNSMTLAINGKEQIVLIKNEYHQLLDSLGMSNSANKKIKEIKAPMPGLVLEVIAENKQNMDKGSTLLILEAMKMENIIKSPDEVIVKKIHVSPGDTVEKNQVLITFA